MESVTLDVRWLLGRAGVRRVDWAVEAMSLDIVCPLVRPIGPIGPILHLLVRHLILLSVDRFRPPDGGR